MLYFPLVGKRGCESALLQAAGYQREDAEHAYHAVILTGQQAGEEYAENQVQ